MSLSSGFEDFEMECGWLCVGTMSHVSRPCRSGNVVYCHELYVTDTLLITLLCVIY